MIGQTVSHYSILSKLDGGARRTSLHEGRVAGQETAATDIDGGPWMKTSALNCDLVDREISKLIAHAWENSGRWTNVLEYDGPVNEKPVLADGVRLAVFWVEYSVNRTIWKGKRDVLPTPAFKLWWLAARGSSATPPHRS